MCLCGSYEVVVWFDAKQFPEIAKGERRVCFQTEVGVVVGRRETASLAGPEQKGVSQTKRKTVLPTKRNNDNSSNDHNSLLFEQF